MLFVPDDSGPDVRVHRAAKRTSWPPAGEGATKTRSDEKDASFLSLDNQSSGASPIPFLPGALRYFREKGLKVN
jgi:hypothetical protein